MSSKRKLISTLLCVGALTAGLFVSGCGSEKAENVASAVSSAVDSKSDEKVNKAFSEIIDATNKFNDKNTTWGTQFAENIAKMKNGFDEHGLNNQPDYEILQNNLKKSKETGNTYKEVDVERDNVLAVLDELVPVSKELKSYTDSKAFLNDGKAKGNELTAKYVAAVEKFNAAYGKLSDVVKAANKEQTKKNIEKMKKEGYKNYATAMEATLRFTDLVDEVERTEKNPDKAKVEKEMTEIMALINGIDRKEADSLKRNANDVVGAIRQVMVDPNDRYQDRNLQRMIQQFNNYIGSFNSLSPNKLDDVKK